jgi:hypothetical protein
MLDFLNLQDDLLQACHESLGIVIVKNIQVDALIATSKKGFSVTLCLDVPTNGSKHKRSRIDRLKITSWHLQHD